MGIDVPAGQDDGNRTPFGLIGACKESRQRNCTAWFNYKFHIAPSISYCVPDVIIADDESPRQKVFIDRKG